MKTKTPITLTQREAAALQSLLTAAELLSAVAAGSPDKTLGSVRGMFANLDKALGAMTASGLASPADLVEDDREITRLQDRCRATFPDAANVAEFVRYFVNPNGRVDSLATQVAGTLHYIDDPDAWLIFFDRTSNEPDKFVPVWEAVRQMREMKNNAEAESLLQSFDLEDRECRR